MSGTVSETKRTGFSAVREHEMPFGTRLLPQGEGVAFRLWAPSAQSVDLVLGETILPMPKDPDGWARLIHPTATVGDCYQFRINGELRVPDPASRYQPQGTHGPSQVMDPAAFQWENICWTGRPWEEAVIYELHVGTFTPEGTFLSLIDKLPHLVELGVTAIELMPIAEFTGARNWGYDGVLMFAPESAYGTPDDLKALVQAAHRHGLMVFLDVVYNHFGADGNYLHAFAEPFFTEKYHTPWGAAIQFEGPQPVRDFFIHNALYWLNEFQLDGLRLDAVHTINDASACHFLYALAAAVREALNADRHVHLILENEDNQARFLNHEAHREQSGFYSAQWNDDFHHAAHVLATGETDGYYTDYAPPATGKAPAQLLARALCEGFIYQGEPSAFRNGKRRGESSAHLPTTAFINFLQNHDQIGNHPFGARLSDMAPPEARRALAEILLLAPSIPMLFMGEEWQTRQPFLFFCDFDPALNELVRQGRRREFAHVPAFSNPALLDELPDPTRLDSFARSRLDWSELAESPHAEWLAFYRHLLHLRQKTTVRLLKAADAHPLKTVNCNVFEQSALWVEWPLKQGGTLVLAANPTPRALTFPAPPLDNKNLKGQRAFYASGPQVFEEVRSGRMPAWSVLWLTDASLSGIESAVEKP